MTTSKSASRTPTNNARRAHTASIASKMQASGVPAEFILNIALLCMRDVRSAYELMALWEDAGDNEADRNEVLIAMQELLDDVENKSPRKVKPYIHFDQLDGVAAKVLAHKAKLRDIIDRNGGISKVAELCGIPQPSLSRMLSSASMPRRSTLYKIANALNLPETEIVTEFVR